MAPPNRKRKECCHHNSKQVKFSEVDICVPSSTMSVSTGTTVNSETSVKDKPVVFENKILRYLNKLRNYWRSAPSAEPQQPIRRRENAKDTFQRVHTDGRQERVNKNVSKPMVPRPEKYTSKISNVITNKRSSTSNQTMPPSNPNQFDASCSCNNSAKAYDIVCAAIEYGVANGIVTKKGEYFWISQEHIERSHRSLTPGYALHQKGSQESTGAEVHNHEQKNDKVKSPAVQTTHVQTTHVQAPHVESKQVQTKHSSESRRSCSNKTETDVVSYPKNRITKQAHRQNRFRDVSKSNELRSPTHRRSTISPESRYNPRSRSKTNITLGSGVSSGSSMSTSTTIGRKSSAPSPPRKTRKTRERKEKPFRKRTF